MKTASAALISALAAIRPAADATLCIADCYTFTLAAGTAVGIAGGTVLAYTDLDLPVWLNGMTYAANSLQISGLRYKCSIGVNVDRQQITLNAAAGMTIGGWPFLQALRLGLLDGAEVQRARAFFTSFNGASPLVPIGSIILFKGRVAQIDSIGRTSAQITVASDLTLLAVDMPRNLYQPNCVHTLYDGGCGLERAAYTGLFAVETGSTNTQINCGGITAAYQQGALTFTSGANTGVTATIKAASSGVLALAYPLPNVPAIGDLFSASFGCDHTSATCASQFGNLANFRGFPFVPPPQIITGPLSSTFSSGGK